MDARRKPLEHAEPSSKEISAAGLADLMSDVDRELGLDDADADFTIILNNLTLA